MRRIDEVDLILVIPLVAEKIRSLSYELSKQEGRVDTMSDDEVDARCDMQERHDRLHVLLRNLEIQHDAAVKEKYILPSFEELIKN